MIWASVFQNKHRYSFNFEGEKMDHIMAKTIRDIYNVHGLMNGYVSNYNWSSCFHDGEFHPEICLFDVRYIISEERQEVNGGISKTINTKYLQD